MDWLAVHSQDETDERLGMRKELQDVSSLVGKLRAIKINKPDIVGAGFETYLAEISSIENRRGPATRASVRSRNRLTLGCSES